jgi:hypothetical protein
MRNTTITVPARKARVAVVRALLGRIFPGAGRHRVKAGKRQDSTDHFDLAQRVREVGEW